MNSPGRQEFGWWRIEMSRRNRSAWPHVRQIRVPRGISPRARSERVPPPVIPVLSSLDQTKSVPLQLEQTGAKRTSPDLGESGPGHYTFRRGRRERPSPRAPGHETNLYRRGLAPPRAPMFATITVAVDGSPTAQQALDIAIDLAQKYGSALNIVAVAPLVPLYVASAE